jgi:hypothetical protein
MTKVYTTRAGDVIQIGQYGPASNDAPAIVPEEVAAEFAGRTDLRVESPEAERPTSIATPRRDKRAEKDAQE